MCNKISQIRKATQLSAKYKAEMATKQVVDEPKYQAFGYDQPKLTIIKNDGIRKMDYMLWGINKLLHARADTIWQKTTFAASIAKYRCILPIEGFFEYQKRGKDSIPYWIFPKEAEGFNIACIYSSYTINVAGEEFNCFAQITTEPNEMMAKIHDRMLVILADDQIDAWLDPTTSRPILDSMMKPYDTNLMQAHKVDPNFAKMGNVKAAIEEVRTNPDLFEN